MAEDEGNITLENGLSLDEISVDESGRVVIANAEFADALRRTLSHAGEEIAAEERVKIGINIGPFCGISINRKRC
jgi:hypothetical protein